jgi:hypothetical protein
MELEIGTELDFADLKADYRLQSDGGDPWGSAMSAFFQVANEMHRRGMDHPQEWKYHPGAGRMEGPEDWTDENTPGFAWECVHATDDALEALGALLSRYIDKLRTAGHSY